MGKKNRGKAEKKARDAAFDARSKEFSAASAAADDEDAVVAEAMERLKNVDVAKEGLPNFSARELNALGPRLGEIPARARASAPAGHGGAPAADDASQSSGAALRDIDRELTAATGGASSGHSALVDEFRACLDGQGRLDNRVLGGPQVEGAELPPLAVDALGDAWDGAAAIADALRAAPRVARNRRGDVEAQLETLHGRHQADIVSRGAWSAAGAVARGPDVVACVRRDAACRVSDLVAAARRRRRGRGGPRSGGRLRRRPRAPRGRPGGRRDDARVPRRAVHDMSHWAALAAALDTPNFVPSMFALLDAPRAALALGVADFVHHLRRATPFERDEIARGGDLGGCGPQDAGDCFERAVLAALLEVGPLEAAFRVSSDPRERRSDRNLASGGDDHASALDAPAPWLEPVLAKHEADREGAGVPQGAVVVDARLKYWCDLGERFLYELSVVADPPPAEAARATPAVVGGARFCPPENMGLPTYCRVSRIIAKGPARVEFSTAGPGGFWENTFAFVALSANGSLACAAPGPNREDNWSPADAQARLDAVARSNVKSLAGRCDVAIDADGAFGAAPPLGSREGPRCAACGGRPKAGAGYPPLGQDAQKKIGGTKVLFLGFASVNVELCKNLVLAGFSATIADDGVASGGGMDDCAARVDAACRDAGAVFLAVRCGGDGAVAFLDLGPEHSYVVETGSGEKLKVSEPTTARYCSYDDMRSVAWADVTPPRGKQPPLQFLFDRLDALFWASKHGEGDAKKRKTGDGSAFAAFAARALADRGLAGAASEGELARGA
ncbi:SUMO activating enzyme [Aureococcus anophagefferens]|nr:SUMO activating enzyme [Aureococcus anophagefferens]